MTKPHRKDGYVHRRRVHVRMDESIIEAIDDLASSLSLSRAHVCDLILGIAVDEGGEWLEGCIRRRVKEALRRGREKWS